MSFISPDGSIEVSTTILAYVDDSSGGVNALGIWRHEHSDNEELEKVSQGLMQTYEHYLYLTGGQVNLRKTFVYHLVPDHTALLPRFCESTDFSPSLQRSEDGVSFRIPQRATTTAHRFLGAYISPSGDRSTQIKVLSDKVKMWIESIGRGNFWQW